MLFAESPLLPPAYVCSWHWFPGSRAGAPSNRIYPTQPVSTVSTSTGAHRLKLGLFQLCLGLLHQLSLVEANQAKPPVSVAGVRWLRHGLWDGVPSTYLLTD